MPTDNVFTKSHDEAIGMIGSTLDFIAGESAKAAEQQRTREFQQGEYQKERDFRAGEEKKKNERDVRTKSLTEYWSNLDLLNTPEARVLKSKSIAATQKDPEDWNAIMAGSEGLGNMGIDVEGILNNPSFPGAASFLSKDIKKLTMPQYQDFQQLYQAHRNVLAAKTDRERQETIKNFADLISANTRNKMIELNNMSRFGMMVPTGEADEKGNPIITYDTQYSDQADVVAGELDQKYGEVMQYLARGEMPPSDKIKGLTDFGTPTKRVKEAKERSRAQYSAGQITELEKKTGDIEKRITEMKTEEKSLITERDSLKKKISKSRWDPNGPSIGPKEVQRLEELNGKIKNNQSRREQFEQSLSEHKTTLKQRKSTAGAVTDPLGLLGK